MNLFSCTTRLYKDAELRYTQSGSAILNFKGAVDAGYGDNKTTTWIKFVLFGKRAENLAPYLKDKTQVALHGELANRKFTDKDGNERYSLEVTVNDLTLVGGKPDGQSEQQQAPQRQARPVPKPPADDLGDDIPF